MWAGGHGEDVQWVKDDITGAMQHYLYSPSISRFSTTISFCLLHVPVVMDTVNRYIQGHLDLHG
jgi:hypothetical protein